LLHVSFHHIAVDLWSSTYIFDEFGELYAIATSGGQPPPLPTQFQYTDYVRWQQDMLAGLRGKKLWEYWKNQLEENIAPIRLPIQITEPLHQRFVGAAHPFKIGKELTSRLREGARELGTTLYTLLLTGFEALLCLYSQREKFLLRTLAVGRSRADFEKVVGFFANPVVLNADFSKNPTFREAVRRVQANITDAIAHQDFPFELLMEKIGFGGKAAVNPNPEIMFILQTPQRFVSVRRDKHDISDHGIFAPGKTGIQLNLGGLVVEKFNPHQRVTLNDLSVEMAEVGNELSGVIHYRTDLYLPQSIARLTAHFTSLLEHMSHNYDLLISSFSPEDGFPKAEAKQDQVRPYLRDALRDPHIQDAFVTPRNETEKKLAEIWQEVLGNGDVSVFDNFFEKGGGSLQALQFMTLIRERFQVELPLRQLFEVRTIAGLSEALNHAEAASESPPIEPIWRDRELPLSFAQQRLWFVDRLTGGHALYNIPIAVRLKGPLDVDLLEKCFNTIISRHEALRTRFCERDGQPTQEILAQLEIKITREDLASWPAADQLDEARRRAKKEAGKPFDLDKGPLIRAVVYTLDREDHMALLTLHHIIADGWSFAIVLREIAQLYAAFVQSRPSPLPELLIQYADFAYWQRERLRGRTLEYLLDYWRKKLEGLPPLALPTDRTPSPIRSYSGGSVFFQIPEALTVSLRQLSQQQDVTLFMLLLAAFYTLLSRYCEQDDIAVGSPVSGRLRTETEELIGCFINILVLRTDLSHDPVFLDLLERVKTTALDAYEHQDLPFEKLVECLRPDRRQGRDPLFQVMFSMQNIDLPPMHIPLGPTLQRFDIDRGITPFALTLHIGQEQETLAAVLEYQSDFFDHDTIQRMADHFLRLLEGITADPARPLSKLPLMSQAETEQVIFDWNRTEKKYPAELTLDMFERQVKATPNRTAVQQGEESWSYAEVEKRANQIAHYLLSQGVDTDKLVGVCLPRSVELVVSLLGVLKSGAAYIPLDPAHPQARLFSIVTDSCMDLLLTGNQESKHIWKNHPDAPSLVALKAVYPVIAGMKDVPPAKTPSPEDTAYVIYTSGSTGTPKGVKISHAALANYLHWNRNLFMDMGGDGILLQSSLVFDFSVTCLYTALVTGYPLFLVPDSPAEQMAAGLDRRNTEWSLLKLTPLHAQVLGAQLSSPHFQAGVKNLILGGEPLKYEQVAAWFQRFPGLRIFNEYGPTEVTVGCCVFQVPDQTHVKGPVPIGRPLSNTHLYILDRWQNPVPIGIPGELYIGGQGLADGYLNRPELTAEKFIPNPIPGTPDNRLFRSGDRARYLPTGDIEFLGRNDDQVKISGYRVACGEVEAALERFPAVQTAAVLAEPEKGDSYLRAFIVASEPEDLDPEKLQKFLRDQIPSYMLPKKYILIKEMPLTPGGKLDRSALAEIKQDSSAGTKHLSASSPTQTFLPPLTEIEKQLARIWSQILGIPKIGLKDDFFALGGHSLQALRIVAMIKNQMGFDLHPAQFFAHPSIAGLSSSLASVKTFADQEHPVPASRIIVFRSGTAGPSWYCLPPSGGAVTAYRDLVASLPEDLRLFGLHSKGITDPTLEHDSIEAMGEDFARIIHSHDRSSGSVLVGWSLGGLIALSTAKALEALGPGPTLVGLIDPQERSIPRRLSTASLWRQVLLLLPEDPSLEQEVHHWASLEEGPQRQAVVDWAVRNHLLPDQASKEWLIHKMELIHKHNRLIGSYVLPKIKAPVFLWGAAGEFHEDEGTHDFDFSQCTKGAFHRFELDADHFSIMHFPQVKTLASSLTQVLSDLRKEPAPRGEEP
jgi:amino acid adenylation domain-containing protein